MTDICPNCGVNVNSNEKYCGSCGKAIFLDNQASNPSEEILQEQSCNQTQTYSQIPPKTSNKKLILGLIAIISLIIIIVIVFFVLLGGGLKNQFVGTWNMTSGEDTNTSIGTSITFENNGDLKAGYGGYNLKVGSWSVENDKLCLDIKFEYFSEYASGKQCITYKFSEDGKSLTLLGPTGFGNTIVLTKI